MATSTPEHMMAPVSCYTERTHSSCYSLKYPYEGLLAETRRPMLVSIKQSWSLTPVFLRAYFLLPVVPAVTHSE